jgi:hypothetical protein
VAGEVQLDRGGEDPQLAALGVVHEHGLAETEIGGDGLAVRRGHLGAVEEHPQGVAGLSKLAAEHPQDMQS